MLCKDQYGQPESNKIDPFENYVQPARERPEKQEAQKFLRAQPVFIQKEEIDGARDRVGGKQRAFDGDIAGPGRARNHETH